MTRNTVLSFPSRRAVQAPPQRPLEAGCAVWLVAELPDERQCGEWLDQVILGTPHESMAMSLWRNQPNLRQSTEKLASFITPKWPAASGAPLLQVAVERAVTRAQQAIEQGQAFEGRLVGVYLYGLLAVVSEIAQVVLRGEDRDGQLRRWEYFSQPLLYWARQHGIERVLVQRAETPPSEVVLTGLRTHMTACLTDPVDAGYLAKHAGQG
ncbi:hypothetical protein [Ramlibacter sp. AN1133]|uniref:hypothetical protein n=1 Tax=Ramlibacter sp. AN1133 TaxID=3133429 RepID=UPI0030BED1B3